MCAGLGVSSGGNVVQDPCVVELCALYELYELNATRFSLPGMRFMSCMKYMRGVRGTFKALCAGLGVPSRAETPSRTSNGGNTLVV